MLLRVFHNPEKVILYLLLFLAAATGFAQVAVTFPFTGWSQIGSPQWRGRTFSKDGYTFTNTQSGCVMSVRVSKAGTGGCVDVGCSGAGCTLTNDCLTNSGGNSINNCTPVNQGTSVEFCVDWGNKTSQIIVDISFSIPITNPNFQIYDINTNNNFTDDLVISAVNCASATIFPSSVTGMLGGTSYNSANGNIYQTNINNTCQGNCASNVTVNFTGTVRSIRIVYASNATLPVASTNPSFQYIYLRPISGTTALVPNVSVPLPPCNSSSTTVNLGASATSTSGATFTWTAGGTGIINSGAGTFSPNVTSPGTYTLTVTNANGCSASGSVALTTINCILLPIELTYFKAACYNENEINLDWQTATEKNNDRFLIQQMKEGDDDFKTVGTMKGAGNSNSAKHYSFIDKRDNKEEKNVLYYRLKQIDKDGTFHYSNLISISNCSEDALPIIYPNPTEGKIYFKNIGGSETFNLEFLNPIGKKIYSGPITGNTEFDLTVYGKGIYYLILSNSSRKIQKKIIVQ